MEEVALLKNNDHKSKWIKRRRNTFILFCLQYFFNGMEQSITSATLWLYLTTIIKPDNLNLMYGLISSIIFVNGLVFINIVSYWSDRTKRVKNFILIANFLCIIGNCLYLLPYSAFLPLVGRFLIGFTIVIRPLMVGEITRSYSVEVKKTRLPLFTTCYGIGKGVAPWVATMLQGVSFSIGSLHITYVNISPIILGASTIILEVLLVFFAYDLNRSSQSLGSTHEDINDEIVSNMERSKSNINEEMQSNMERSQTNINDEMQSNMEGSHSNNNIDEMQGQTSMLEILCNLLSRFDIILMYMSSFIAAFLIQFISAGLPIIVLDKLNHSISTLGILYNIRLGIGLAFLFIFTFLKPNVNTYACGIVSWMLFIPISVALLILNYHPTEFVTMVSLVLIAIATEVFKINILLFMTVTLSNLVSNQHQSFANSILTQCDLLASLISASVSAYIAENLLIYGVTSIVVLFLVITITLIRKRFICNDTVLL